MSQNGCWHCIRGTVFIAFRPTKTIFMRKVIETHCFGFTILMVALFANIVAIAQDSAASVTVNKTTTTSTVADDVPAWYTAPWVWILAVIVLVLIIVAAARGNKNTASTTTRTTVTRTTEVE